MWQTKKPGQLYFPAHLPVMWLPRFWHRVHHSGHRNAVPEHWCSWPMVGFWAQFNAQLKTISGSWPRCLQNYLLFQNATWSVSLALEALFCCAATIGGHKSKGSKRNSLLGGGAALVECPLRLSPCLPYFGGHQRFSFSWSVCCCFRSVGIASVLFFSWKVGLSG